MADFAISGRIERLGPDRFVCTAVAHAAEGAESSLGHSLSETCASHSSALDALNRLSQELGARIRSRGDRVLAVGLEES